MLEWLKGILGESYTEDIDKAISAEIGKGFVAKADFDAKNTELKTARGQLAAANRKIADFEVLDIETVRREAADWKQKAEQAEKDAAAQVAALQSDFAAQSAASGVKFSSESAKKAFLADLKAKKLALQDGKLLGFEDFLADYKKSDPTAFASGYPDVQDGGDPHNKPAGSAREQFAAWFEQATK